jgi:hypothetical protein
MIIFESSLTDVAEPPLLNQKFATGMSSPGGEETGEGELNPREHRERHFLCCSFVGELNHRGLQSALIRGSCHIRVHLCPSVVKKAFFTKRTHFLPGPGPSKPFKGTQSVSRLFKGSGEKNFCLNTWFAPFLTFYMVQCRGSIREVSPQIPKPFQTVPRCSKPFPGKKKIVYFPGGTRRCLPWKTPVPPKKCRLM